MQIGAVGVACILTDSLIRPVYGQICTVHAGAAADAQRLQVAVKAHIPNRSIGHVGLHGKASVGLTVSSQAAVDIIHKRLGDCAVGRSVRLCGPIIFAKNQSPIRAASGGLHGHGRVFIGSIQIQRFARGHGNGNQAAACGLGGIEHKPNAADLLEPTSAQTVAVHNTLQHGPNLLSGDMEGNQPLFTQESGQPVCVGIIPGSHAGPQIGSAD